MLRNRFFSATGAAVGFAATASVAIMVAAARNAAEVNKSMHNSGNSGSSNNGNVTKIPKNDFYLEYHGHTIPHLSAALSVLRQNNSEQNKTTTKAAKTSIVFLAGDSSLDNKFYVLEPNSAAQAAPPSSGYDKILDPPKMQPDVAFHLTKLFSKHNNSRCSSNNDNSSSRSYAALNCAIEESCIGERDRGAKLLPQDEFIRHNITSDDILAVSLGGNDVALKMNAVTAMSMLWLTRGYAREENIRNGTAWGLKHLVNLLRDDYWTVVSRLTEKNKPRLVILLSIYYPSVTPDPTSWASKFLNRGVNYDANPRRLHLIIDRLHEMCYVPLQEQQNTSNTRVVSVAMSSVMDGSDKRDYVQRVEPSEFGGEKIAKLIAGVIEKHDGTKLVV